MLKRKTNKIYLAQAIFWNQFFVNVLRFLLFLIFLSGTPICLDIGPFVLII